MTPLRWAASMAALTKPNFRKDRRYAALLKKIDRDN
jgi:hypothetical protein